MNRDQINKIDEQVSRLLNERGLEYDDLIEAMIDYDGLIDDGEIADDEIVNRFLDDLYRRCGYNSENAADMITICGTLLLEGYFDDTEDEILGYEINGGKLWIYVCRDDGSGVATFLRRIEQILEQYRIEELQIVECEERMMGCSEHPTLLDII